MPYSRFFVPYYPIYIWLIFLVVFVSISVLKDLYLKLVISLFISFLLIYSSLINENINAIKWWNYSFISPLDVSSFQKDFHSLSVLELKQLLKENDYYAISEFGYIPYHLREFRGIDMMGLNQKEIALNYKYYSFEDAIFASRDFVLSKLPEVIAMNNVFLNNNSIEMDDGIKWFFNSYFQSQFFLNYYNVNNLSTKKSNFMNYWIYNKQFKGVSKIDIKKWGKNFENLFTGFNLESNQIWVSPISRLFIQPLEGDTHFYLRGYVPDINQYKEKKLEIKINVDKNYVGELNIYNATISESGEFYVSFPIDKLIFEKNINKLVTIFASKLDLKNDSRNLSFILNEIGFENKND